MRASLDQPALARLTTQALGLPKQQQAAFVQSAVNLAVRNSRLAYDCSDDGYWAAAQETLARGMGDCIDLAIAKMEALRLLGFPKRDLYLTTGYFGNGPRDDDGLESAALLVRIDHRFWLLTERPEQLIEATDPVGEDVRFTPVLTYGVGTTWIHGRPIKSAFLDD